MFSPGMISPACAALFRIFRSSCVAYTGFLPPFLFCVWNCTDDSGELADEGSDGCGEVLTDDMAVVLYSCT